jgi:hypothetical protein
MISVIGIGTAASAIADKFDKIPQYRVYTLNDEIQKNTARNFKLKKFKTPEEYEKNIPNLKEFFKDVNDHVQVFVVGSSYSSNYSLGILEQIKDKKIELFYIKPDIELLTGTPLLMENMVFRILQEYARSGLFGSITFFSNQEIERCTGDIPIKGYYESLNKSIFSAVHYLNYFTHTDPEIGQVAKAGPQNRIRAIGALDIKNLHEKWFFDLDAPRDMCYYLCINDKRLETEGGLHRQIVDNLKKKPTNAFKKVSYAIYETPHKDFGFCVAHTNAIQENNTLDKIV